MTQVETTVAGISHAQRTALIVGVLGLAATLIELRNPVQFHRSYLFAYECWISVPLGCLGLLMLHHLTGGKWGLHIRRVAEAGSYTFPLMAILFIPNLVGMKILYPWARPELVATDQMLKYKEPYLNPSFFTIRALIYFVILIYLGTRLNSLARKYDETRDSKLLSRMGRMSGPGLVLWSAVVTWGSIDWIMSLEPHWFSTIYGFVFIVISALTALAFMVFVGTILAHREPMASIASPVMWNDMGNLLLAFVMLWTYLNFDQFLIIWTGNLKDEIPWFVSREAHGWGVMALFLVIFYFAIPFLLLLQRAVTRRMKLLASLAFALVIVGMVDVYWQMMPAFDPQGPRFHFTDITADIGIGGIWVAAFLWRLKSRPLMPVHDRSFEEVAAHGD